MSQAVRHALYPSAGLMQKSRVTLEVLLTGAEPKGKRGLDLQISVGGELLDDHAHSLRFLIEVLQKYIIITSC